MVSGVGFDFGSGVGFGVNPDHCSPVSAFPGVNPDCGSCGFGVNPDYCSPVSAFPVVNPDCGSRVGSGGRSGVGSGVGFGVCSGVGSGVGSGVRRRAAWRTFMPRAPPRGECSVRHRHRFRENCFGHQHFYLNKTKMA